MERYYTEKRKKAEEQERYIASLEAENKRLRELIDDALMDVSMVKGGADDWIEFVEEKLKQALEGGGE